MMIHVDPSAVRARLTLDAIAARYGLEMHDDEEADGWKVCGWCPGCGHARSSRRRHLGHAKFVARVRAERILGHELIRDLECERSVKAALHVDLR